MRFRLGGFGAALGADGRIYVFGGENVRDDPSFLTQIYDPKSDTWTKGPRLPVAVDGNAGAALGSRVYSLGGWTTGDGQVATAYFLHT
jgi:N-acetylneuraminic acid mutarotase